MTDVEHHRRCSHIIIITIIAEITVQQLWIYRHTMCGTMLSLLLHWPNIAIVNYFCIYTNHAPSLHSLQLNRASRKNGTNCVDDAPRSNPTPRHITDQLHSTPTQLLRSFCRRTTSGTQRSFRVSPQQQKRQAKCLPNDVRPKTINSGWTILVTNTIITVLIFMDIKVVTRRPIAFPCHTNTGAISRCANDRVGAVTIITPAPRTSTGSSMLSSTNKWWNALRIACSTTMQIVQRM